MLHRLADGTRGIGSVAPVEPMRMRPSNHLAARRLAEEGTHGAAWRHVLSQRRALRLQPNHAQVAPLLQPDERGERGGRE